MSFITVEQAADILQRGGVVAVPTETVYGLAADATNAKAIEKIYSIKNRPKDNPLICHFASYEMAKKFVTDVPDYLKKLISTFSPGPISYLLNLPANSPLLPATGGRQSVIIRIPNHPVLNELLMKVDFPLAAPSANTSGKFSPTTAEMVEKDLGNKVDGIIDGGKCEVGLESTIIDCRGKNKISILRPGAIGSEEIKITLQDSSVSVIEFSSSEETTPGGKYKHYAPETPIHEINSFSEIKSVEKSFAVLLLSEQKTSFELWKKNNSSVQSTIIELGAMNDLEQIAQHLYKHLQELDEQQVPVAYLLKTDWGNTSMGKAIANRLSKILVR